MKKLMAVLMFSTVMLGISGVTQAAESMSKGTVGNWSHDCMKKNSMGKSSMGKGCTSKQKTSKTNAKKNPIMNKDAQ